MLQHLRLPWPGATKTHSWSDKSLQNHWTGFPICRIVPPRLKKTLQTKLYLSCWTATLLSGISMQCLGPLVAVICCDSLGVHAHEATRTILQVCQCPVSDWGTTCQIGEPRAEVRALQVRCVFQSHWLAKYKLTGIKLLVRLTHDVIHCFGSQCGSVASNCHLLVACICLHADLSLQICVVQLQLLSGLLGTSASLLMVTQSICTFQRFVTVFTQILALITRSFPLQMLC